MLKSVSLARRKQAYRMRLVICSSKVGHAINAGEICALASSSMLIQFRLLQGVAAGLSQVSQ